MDVMLAKGMGKEMFIGVKGADILIQDIICLLRHGEEARSEV